MSKLTLSVDAGIIAKAKEYALNKGVSLSELVENYFNQLVKKKNASPISDEFLEITGMWKDIRESNKEMRSRLWKK